MSKKPGRGFTLIEVMVVVVIVAGLAFVLIAGNSRGLSSLSWGVNGMTETRCISGMQFVVGEGGQARQVLDDHGRGVRCQQ